MTVLEATRAHLLTLSAVTALVNGRIWALRFPPNPTLPGIRLTQIGDVHTGHLRGAARWKWARIQVDCVAASLTAARALDQAVMGDFANGAVTGLRGADALIGSPAIRLQGSYEILGYREQYDAEELKQSLVIRDYQVWIED